MIVPDIYKIYNICILYSVIVAYQKVLVIIWPYLYLRHQHGCGSVLSDFLELLIYVKILAMVIQYYVVNCHRSYPMYITSNMIDIERYDFKCLARNKNLKRYILTDLRSLERKHQYTNMPQFNFLNINHGCRKQ